MNRRSQLVRECAKCHRLVLVLKFDLREVFRLSNILDHQEDGILITPLNHGSLDLKVFLLYHLKFSYKALRGRETFAVRLLPLIVAIVLGPNQSYSHTVGVVSRIYESISSNITLTKCVRIRHSVNVLQLHSQRHLMKVPKLRRVDV